MEYLLTMLSMRDRSERPDESAVKKTYTYNGFTGPIEREGWFITIECLGQLQALIREMYATVEQARMAGATALARTTRDASVARYEALLGHGVIQNPQPPTTYPHRRGRRKQRPVRNLLDRLRTYEHEALAFLEDFAVPFDNNRAERDLRPIKVQQKISGTFRSEAGADAFCPLRSLISTWRKQGRSALAALETTSAGRSLSLQFPI